MNADRIIKAKNLVELLERLDEFCRESYLREDDIECLKLKKMIVNEENNDILMLLSSYLDVCEDGDEIIEALYEFIGNCKGFAEADKEMTQQVTKSEFEAILDECEDKCGLRTCIEEKHILKTAETELYNENREFCLKFKENNINLILPRIDINTDIKSYISEELGTILYYVLKTKLSDKHIQNELFRYIPEIRHSEKSIKQLLKEYFCTVVLYKKRKPEVRSQYDEYTKQVIVLEFFKKIIVHYLKE